jgi:type IV pilus assembly protein PilM
MRPLRFNRKPLIGLDVDSSSIRMIQLRCRDGRYSVTGAAAADIAPCGEDRERQRTQAIRAIRECIEALKPPGKLAVCGLRGPDVIVRAFEFPGLPADETEGAVRLEASQMCPFSMQEGEFDHQITSDGDNKTRGFWVAAAGALIESRRQLLHEAGLQCVLMDVDGLALLNCAERLNADRREGDDSGDTLKDQPRSAVLDVGDSYATIAVVDSAGRPFIRDVSSAGHEIIRQIARLSRLSMDDIRTALLGQPATEDPQIRENLDKACDRLLDDIATTLRYYAAQNHTVRVSRLLVCGRFASATGFVECLRNRLPLEVVAWNPAAALDADAGSESRAVLEKTGPSMAAAVGLAMRTI